MQQQQRAHAAHWTTSPMTCRCKQSQRTTHISSNYASLMYMRCRNLDEVRWVCDSQSLPFRMRLARCVQEPAPEMTKQFVSRCLQDLEVTCSGMPHRIVRTEVYKARAHKAACTASFPFTLSFALSHCSNLITISSEQRHSKASSGCRLLQVVEHLQPWLL